MRDEPDEPDGPDKLDAFLDAGRAQYGGRSLDDALSAASTWAEARVARRRRVAGGWVAGGVLGTLLAGGGAIATAMNADPEPQATPASFALVYASDDGGYCLVEVQPFVHSTAPLPWTIARDYLTDVDPPPVDLPALTGGGAAADRELAVLTEALTLGVEAEILRGTLSRVDVTLTAEYSCTPAPSTGDDYGVTSPIVGDDFGRVPTVHPGRAPDVVGFFRASTGQICEIQIKVDPSWEIGAREDALAARAYLASVDFTTVDYSVALSEMAGFWPPDHDPGFVEAAALSRTVTDQMIVSLTPPGTPYPHITSESWSQCDPEPSA